MLPRAIGLLAGYTAIFVVLVIIQFTSRNREKKPPVENIAVIEPEKTKIETEAAEQFGFNELHLSEMAISASYEPQYFSPDGDGVNDELFITLGVNTERKIAGWVFDILQPTISGRSGQVFKHFEGSGVPTARIVWDGRSDAQQTRQGIAYETVQAATDYLYTFSVTDTDGNKSEPLTGEIHIDVLVIRENDGRLRIQVPSIVFRTNAADFGALTGEIVANNRQVISRIAIILNKFPDYSVQVEGHANPENLPGTSARQTEDQYESRRGSISELRAQAIVNFLVENGVERSRLTAIGMGISRPLTEYADMDNRWKNRRVEFYLEKNS
jgi:outer membrane protein OmpA-like peptidoglycan-associated protein